MLNLKELIRDIVGINDINDVDKVCIINKITNPNNQELGIIVTKNGKVLHEDKSFTIEIERISFTENKELFKYEISYGELFRCENCGDLIDFDDTFYINNENNEKYCSIDCMEEDVLSIYTYIDYYDYYDYPNCIYCGEEIDINNYYYDYRNKEYYCNASCYIEEQDDCTEIDYKEFKENEY